MKIDISTSFIAATLVSLMFLTFGGLAHYAYAVTVITVEDEDSCEALSLSGGTADFNNDICTIPGSATLEIAADEVLDLRIYLFNLGIINNAQGGTINITGTGSLTVNGDSGGKVNNFGTINIESPGGLSSSLGGEVNNFGTINVRAGGNFQIFDSVFTNAPNGLVNNYGVITGSSDNPLFTNDGTINNQETGRFRIHDEMRLFNNPQGVINNHGFMQINEVGIVNNGTLNNYANASLLCSDEGGTCLLDTQNSPRNGTLYNFGALNITSSSDTLHIVETISNQGEIRITSRVYSDRSYDVVNEVTILNQPSGAIENFAKFNNLGVIDNQGEISNHCGTFTNSGTFTGNPVNAGNDNLQPLVSITSLIDVEIEGDTSPGARIRIEGTASDSGDGCGIAKVEVKVKDPVTFELFQSYQISYPIVADDWSTWTQDLILEQERDYAIVARATDLAGNQNWYLTTYRVEFGAEPDQTRPIIEITSPSEHIVTLTGPASGVTLTLEGTASDTGRGVARVEVKINDPDTLELISRYEPATATGPEGEDDYSTWVMSLTFDQEAKYRVTARATDESGNKGWRHVILTVKFVELDFIEFMRQFGTSGLDSVAGVSADASGVYVGGWTEGVFPGQIGAGGRDSFVSQYDFNGNEVWTRQFGTSGSDEANDISVGSSGVYLVGSTNGVFPGQINAGSYDIFVSKYDIDGNEVWTRQFGTPLQDEGFVVAADSSAVYVGGTTMGTLPGQTSAGGFDIFVSKYDFDGNEVWTRQFGTSSDFDFIGDVSVDSSGVYVAGSIPGALPGQSHAGSGDAFIRKYDLDGNEVWTRQFGDSGGDDANGIAVDSSSVYVTGSTQDPNNLGPTDAFIRKYDLDGNEVWTRQFGSSINDNPTGVAIDPSGVYVAGSTSGAFPGQTHAGSSDIFVSKYDIDGNEVWTRQFGSLEFDYPAIVSVQSNSVYVAGRTQGTMPGQASLGGIDGYLAKLET